jgi:hypothetical protein
MQDKMSLELAKEFAASSAIPMVVIDHGAGYDRIKHAGRYSAKSASYVAAYGAGGEIIARNHAA